MRALLLSLFAMFYSFLMTSCYNQGPLTSDAWDLTSQQLDSISFYTTHHYTQNYNFVVTGDSLVVVAQQPEDMSVPEVVSLEMQTTEGEMQKDSITIHRHERIVVAVHFNDIPSFYPTVLCLLISASAVLYSSIQLFGAETWRHFYYHPSLNPFALPFWLGLFVSSVWAIIIVAIATVEDVTRHLPLGSSILYLAGLAAVCAVCYVVFSITTLYYIGYPLLIAYFVFAVRRLSLQETI